MDKKYPKPKGRPIIIKKSEVTCKYCEIVLTTANTYPQQVKHGKYICKQCGVNQRGERESNPILYELKKAVKSLLKRIAAAEKKREYMRSPKMREYQKIRRQRPDVKEKFKLYLQLPKTEELLKKYHESPKYKLCKKTYDHEYGQRPNRKESVKKRLHKRERDLDWYPLNEYFKGSHGHHLNKEDVLYIPKELHMSVSHNVFTGRNMDQINFIAIQWYLLYYWMFDTTARDYITLDKLKGE